MKPSVLTAPAVREDPAAPHVIRELPILVILPHSRCNCRCVMCDIWRIRQIREITAADLEPHMASLRELKVRWVVFSGGEPLMHSDLFALARRLRSEGIRTTLLTAGLTLERHAAQVAEHIDDVIVSIDGPREIHDRIRGVPDAYRRLERGIHALRQHRSAMPIHGRCTVQKSNFRHLRATVEAALELRAGLVVIPGRRHFVRGLQPSGHGPKAPRLNVALDENETGCLSAELEALVADYPQLIQSGFIRENPEKLRRICCTSEPTWGRRRPSLPAATRHGCRR